MSLAALSAARGEADWLRDAREASGERYRETPWPTGSEEEWRRTSLKDLPVEATLDETVTTEVSDLDPASDEARRRLRSARTRPRNPIPTSSGPSSPIPRPAQPPMPRSGTSPARRGPPARSCTSRRGRAWTSCSGPARSPDGRTAPRSPSRCWSPGRTRRSRSSRSSAPPTAPRAGSGASSIFVLERGARVRYASLQLLGDQAWRVSAQRVVVGQDADRHHPQRGDRLAHHQARASTSRWPAPAARASCWACWRRATTSGSTSTPSRTSWHPTRLRTCCTCPPSTSGRAPRSMG